MPTPVEIARQELASGIREPAAYARYSGGRNEAWCAHFVSWVLDQAGIPFASYVVPTPSRANPTASVSQAAKNMSDIGRLFTPESTTPQPNDLIFYKQIANGNFVSPGRFGFPQLLGHIGIVEGVDGDKVVSIEGNLSDRVARARTPLKSASIAFYGRPFTTAQVAGAAGAGIGVLAIAGLGAYLLMRSRK